jgi:hypothetical protein
VRNPLLSTNTSNLGEYRKEKRPRGILLHRNARELGIVPVAVPVAGAVAVVDIISKRLDGCSFQMVETF